MDNRFTGIDVSFYQGDIDWVKAKHDIDFAIIRAGYGKNNIDDKAEQNVKGCEDNNIPFGLYWFSYAYTVEMARNEAKYLLEFVKGHTPLYPLFFDFEYDSVRYATECGVDVTKDLIREMATAFCEELENAGYYAGIYANHHFANNLFGNDLFETYDLWYARWDCNEPNRNVNLWQASSTGRINGIGGLVDIDVAFIDFPSLIKERKLNGYTDKPKFICPNSCPHCPHSKEV